MPPFKEWPLSSRSSPPVLDWYHILVPNQMSPFNRMVTQFKVESPSVGLVPHLGPWPDVSIQQNGHSTQGWVPQFWTSSTSWSQTRCLHSPKRMALDVAQEKSTKISCKMERVRNRGEECKIIYSFLYFNVEIFKGSSIFETILSIEVWDFSIHISTICHNI